MHLSLLQKKLDHAQSLISHFKEPQHNYLTADYIIEKSTTHKNAHVLLMDLMKAFEKIESSWIINVLTVLQTPAWFIDYTKWVLMKGRTSTPRITGQLLPPLQMQRLPKTVLRALAKAKPQPVTPWAVTHQLHSQPCRWGSTLGLLTLTPM